jgi:hypothetical protein
VLNSGVIAEAMTILRKSGTSADYDARGVRCVSYLDSPESDGGAVMLEQDDQHKP